MLDVPSSQNNNQYDRHVTGLSIGKSKQKSGHGVKIDRRNEDFHPCPKGLIPLSPSCRNGGVLLLALCPLADSRRQRQRRTALESGTW